MRTVPVKLEEEVYQWVAGRGKVSAVVREAVEFYRAAQDGEPGRVVSEVEKNPDVGIRKQAAKDAVRVVKVAAALPEVREIMETTPGAVTVPTKKCPYPCMTRHIHVR